MILDYDGTLADFAPTPEHILPDPELIRVLDALAQCPTLHLAAITGRGLDQVQRLLPVVGMLLAGSYGVEVRTPAGDRIDRLKHSKVRPALDTLKPLWADLIAGHTGFFLEDKGWTLALHARLAEDRLADEVLERARMLAQGVLPHEELGLLATEKFLEAGPRLSNKGATVVYLLDRYGAPGAFPVYVGDDIVDEPAFAAVRARGGLGILVAQGTRPSQARCRFESPHEVRRWLLALLKRLEQGQASDSGRKGSSSGQFGQGDP